MNLKKTITYFGLLFYFQLLQEFGLEMNLTREQMEANWTKSALQLMTYMTAKHICVQSGTLGNNKEQFFICFSAMLSFNWFH